MLVNHYFVLYASGRLKHTLDVQRQKANFFRKYIALQCSCNVIADICRNTVSLRIACLYVLVHVNRYAFVFPDAQDHIADMAHQAIVFQGILSEIAVQGQLDFMDELSGQPCSGQAFCGIFVGESGMDMKGKIACFSCRKGNSQQIMNDIQSLFCDMVFCRKHDHDIMMERIRQQFAAPDTPDGHSNMVCHRKQDVLMDVLKIFFCFIDDLCGDFDEDGLDSVDGLQRA